MEVDVAVKGVSVARFESFKPKDTADDRVTSGCVRRKDLSRGTPGFEHRAGGRVRADFFANLQESQRSGVAAWRVPDSKPGGRNGIADDLDVVLEHKHLLIRRADDEEMPIVSGASLEKS
jgi:hypothetical protein